MSALQAVSLGLGVFNVIGVIALWTIHLRERANQRRLDAALRRPWVVNNAITQKPYGRES